MDGVRGHVARVACADLARRGAARNDLCHLYREARVRCSCNTFGGNDQVLTSRCVCVVDVRTAGGGTGAGICGCIRHFVGHWRNCREVGAVVRV